MLNNNIGLITIALYLYIAIVLINPIKTCNMTHYTTPTILLIICLAFTSCSKKTTDGVSQPEIDPTETWHPPQPYEVTEHDDGPAFQSNTETIEEDSDEDGVSMVSPNPPSLEEAIFWIGPSMDHNFSIQAGSVSLKGVYAINNNNELKKDAMGNLMFYPTKSLTHMEFLKSEIGNLDYEEGYLYQVEGTKYYLGDELWGVIVNRVLQKVSDKKEDKVVATSSKKTSTTSSSSNSSKTTTTTTTKRWQTSGKSNTQEEPIMMVSENPPHFLEARFWIGSSKNHTFSTKAGVASVANAYGIVFKDKLEKWPNGYYKFYPEESTEGIIFHSGEINNLDYKEGYYYQVDGILQYSGTEVVGISVNKVLQKVADISQKKSNKSSSQTTSSGKGKTTSTTTSSTSTTTTSTQTKKRTPTNERWKTTKTTTKSSKKSGTASAKKTKGTKKMDTSKTTSATGGSKTAPKPTAGDQSIFWIGASRNVKYKSDRGNLWANDCYVINNIDELEKTPLGDLVFYSPENLDEMELYCSSKIENMDYEEGFNYQVRGTKHYEGNKLKGITVDEVLKMVEDKDYVKVEDLVVFVGPETTKAVGLHGNEVDCYQVQYGTYSQKAEWEGICDGIGGFEYEPGYMYKLKIRRTHMSKREAEMTMDAPASSDLLLTILRKRRM